MPFAVLAIYVLQLIYILHLSLGYGSTQPRPEDYVSRWECTVFY